MSVPDRAAVILDWLEKHDRTPAWLAREIGVTRQSVYMWLRGETKPYDPSVWDKMMLAIANADPKAIQVLGVPAVEGKLTKLPVLRVGTAGDPTLEPDASDSIEIPFSLGFPDYRCVRIEGLSMEPYLKPGDVAIFRQRPTAKDGLVVAVEDHGEIVVKELVESSSGLLLRSFNSAFPDKPMPKGAVILGYMAGLYRDDGEDMMFRHNRAGIYFRARQPAKQ